MTAKCRPRLPDVVETCARYAMIAVAAGIVLVVLWRKGRNRNAPTS